MQSKYLRFFRWFSQSYRNLLLNVNKVSKNLQTFFKDFNDKESRGKIWSALRRWVRKNALLASNLFLLYQISEQRSARRASEFIKTKFENENTFLRSAITGKNANMEDFDWPWYKKIQIKDNGDFRIIGMNTAYEKFYGLDRIKSLGKSNFDLVHEEAAKEWRRVDSLVVATRQPQDEIESFIFLDSTKIPVYSHKWGGIENRYNVVYGVSVPLSVLMSSIKENENLEMVKDSILIKKEQ